MNRFHGDCAAEAVLSHTYVKGKTDIDITNEIETFTDDQLKGPGIAT